MRAHQTRRILTPYAFLGPFLLAFALLSAWPLWRTASLAMSGGGSAIAFVLRDKLAWLALANTIGYALIFSLLQTCGAFAIALLVHHAAPSLRRALAILFFSTHLLGATFAGVLFAALLSGRAGLFNAALLRLGWIASPWQPLESTAWAMPTLIAISVYLGVGFGMLYCLASLRRVDLRLHDAAQLDGAGAVRRLIHVTLPQVRPTLSFLLLAGLFWGLQAFELPYVLFGGPGPGYRALTVTMYLFSLGFEQGQPELAAAVSVVFALIVGGLTIAAAALLRFGREEVTLT